MLELLAYGKSMYGGWYVNWFKNGEYSGENFKTLTELKTWASKNNLVLSKNQRYDNI